MTNTASKHGLRAAAQERSKKHAQRTPLPPRPGAIEDAREVIAAAKKLQRKPHATDGMVNDIRYGEMTAAELRRQAVDMGIEVPTPASRGALLNLIREAELAEPSEPPADTPPARPKPAKTSAAQPATPNAPKLLDASLTPGERKAHAFLRTAQESGWTGEVTTADGRTTLALERGDEKIAQVWNGGSWSYPEAVYQNGENQIRPRNAAEAMRIAAQKEPKLAAVRKEYPHKPKEGRKRIFKPIIPDFENLSDIEIVEAIQNKLVTWKNSVSGKEESARAAGQIHIDRESKTINFISAAPYKAYRAVNWSSVIKVSRHYTKD